MDTKTIDLAMLADQLTIAANQINVCNAIYGAEQVGIELDGFCLAPDAVFDLLFRAEQTIQNVSNELSVAALAIAAGQIQQKDAMWCES